MDAIKFPIRYGGSVTDKEEEKALIASVKHCLQTGNWQTGPEAEAMEREAASFLKVKYGILTNSGSSAGLLALSALELPKGSEVIISACTFPTIFNIILQCNLVPVVVDAKVATYTFDVEDVKEAITPKTRAIIAIHPVGNPVDMPALMSLVKSYKQKIYVIEDNCDGWGSTIGGKPVGSFGDVSITSFHAAHIVSMGVGGGVFTNDKEIAENVRMYRDWGRQANLEKKKHNYSNLPQDYNPRFIYEKIGYNFQILELQAAMGRVQLKKAKKIKEQRKKNFDYLYNALARYDELIMPKWLDDADVCWFAFPLTIKGGLRGKLVEYLEENGVETRSMFAGNITKHPAYADSKFRKTDLSFSDYILSSSFWVSVHPRYGAKEMQYIVDVIDSFFRQCSTYQE